ncbi:MAG TPA: hypothetical protein PJ998_10060 [Terrimesophilobacter sp.]|nr:hypothetical protein [Terrimesophilobacter sp.]
MRNDVPKLQKAWDRIFDAWWLDFAFVIVALSAVLIIPVVSSRVDLLGHLGLARRVGVYSDMITIASLLGGFSTLAFSAYIGWTGRGVERVKRAIGRKLMIVWIASIATPWIAALAILIAKIQDSGAAWTPNPSRWIALAAVALVILSLIRTVMIFVILADLKDNQAAPTKVLNNTHLAVPDDRLIRRTGTGH